jgi:hypothetical protein
MRGNDHVMSDTSELPFPTAGHRRRRDDDPGRRPVERAVGGHSSHYGRPRSWILVGVVIAAFCAGGAAIIVHLWPLFWACAGVVVLSVPAGKIIGIMDDTVEVQGIEVPDAEVPDQEAQGPEAQGQKAQGVEARGQEIEGHDRPGP